MAEDKCNECGEQLKYSEELQTLADNNKPDVTGHYHYSGWYCSVCEY